VETFKRLAISTFYVFVVVVFQEGASL
jgi:hypothetical protein